MERGRPGRSSSCSPWRPCSRKRFRHLPTELTERSTFWAMALLAWPSAAASTILARVTRPCGSERETAKAWSCSCSYEESVSIALGRPAGIGNPPFFDHGGYHRTDNYASYLWDITLAELDELPACGR